MPGEIAHYQIYYILVKNCSKNQLKFCKTYPCADCDSDHNLIMVKYKLRLKKKKPQIPKIQQDKYNNVKLLKRADIVK